MSKLPVTYVTYFEAEEFAHALVHGEECFDECYEDGTWQNEFFEKFDCSIEGFNTLLEHLLPLIDVGEGAFGTYKGFSNLKGEWFIKKEIK